MPDLFTQILQTALFTKIVVLFILFSSTIFGLVLLYKIRVINTIFSQAPYTEIITSISFLQVIISFSLFIYTLVIL